jgi:molybdopterin synthase catalytic subunit
MKWCLLGAVMGGGSITIKVVENELDPDQLKHNLKTDGCGAVVSFLGLVRDFDTGEEVLSLEFDSWKEKLFSVLERLANESITQHGVSSIVVAHRIGTVSANMPIVCIHVASAHRKEAFESCSWLIDELKSQAPLWKKEIKVSGATWKAGLG